MNRQNHNHIDSAKPDPANAISSNSGIEQPTDIILLEIRNDYREARKRLKRYTRFIDRHPQLIILGTPFMLLIVLMVVALAIASSVSDGISILVFSLSLALFLASLIFAIVCAARISSANKIVSEMKDLRQEAASYQRAVALGLDGKNVSRGELGVFEEPLPIARPETATDKVSGGLIFLGWVTVVVEFFRSWGAVSIIASIAALVIAIILVVSKNPINKRNGKVILAIWIVANSISFIVAYNAAQQAQQTQNTQACMASVSSEYNPALPNAADSLGAGLQACQPVGQ